MHTAGPKSVLLFLLFVLIVCFSGVKVIEQQEQTSHRQPKIKTTHHDFINPPSTTFTTTFPTDTSTPGIVTVTPTPTPGSTPTSTPGSTPTSTPGSTPVTVSPTYPVTTPSPTTNNPGGQPASNPVTTTPTPTGGATPAVNPPAVTNAPAVQGQKWCVSKGGAPEKSVQAALDYACGIGKTDCSAIQQGASCYNPNTLQNHASYAFNSYYQKNPVQTSCDFGGVAVLTNVNPSSGSCIFPTSSSATSPTMPSPITTTPTMPSPTTKTPTPTMPSPTTTTPTPNTASSTGTPPAGLSGTSPNILNASNPTLGGSGTGFGDSPPTVSTSSDSMSSYLKPYIGCIIAVISIVIGGIVILDM